MKLKPKWTPGPWQLNKYGSIGAGAGGHVPIVASVEPFYGVDQRFGDHSANARLIAAAPELYAELTDLVMRFESACRHAGSDEEFIKIASSKARAALAKAGETPEPTNG